MNGPRRKNTFDEFVKRQKENSLSDDKGKLLDEWRHHLVLLYSRIKGFIGPYIVTNSISIEYSDIEINEDYLGSYSVQKMLLIIGDLRVIFTPIGTMLFGSRGRVDVTGPAGSARLILVDKRAESARSLVHVSFHPPGAPPPKLKSSGPIDWTWKIIGRPPEMKFVDLSQQSFEDLILEVANG